MGRIPSALALLEAPVHAVVMDTDGTVQTGLSTGLFIRLLHPWMCFHRPPVRARFVLCWANWFATRQAGTRAVCIWLLDLWFFFYGALVGARFVLCWANWFATRQAGTRAVCIRQSP